MTTYERLVSKLGDGLGIALTPDGGGVTQLFAEDRFVLLHADETGECELTVFSVIATAPEDGFPPEKLKRALAMNFFGHEVVGHHLGLFADSLILSASLPIPDLTAEMLAERIVMLARLANTLSGSLACPEPAAAPADDAAPYLGGDFVVA